MADKQEAQPSKVHISRFLAACNNNNETPMQAFVLQEFLSQPRCVQRCAEMNASISCAWSATVFEELAVDGAGPARSAACGSSYRRCSAWLGLYRWPVIWPDASALDGGGTASRRWYCASVDGFTPVPQHWRAGEPDGTDRNDGHVGHCAAVGADGLLTDGLLTGLGWGGGLSRLRTPSAAPWAWVSTPKLPLGGIQHCQPASSSSSRAVL